MTSINAKQKFELKKFVKEMNSHKARHTELVSVYIPAGYDMNKIINHLQQEQGTAENIKSTSTRKNVIDALERMIQHLRLFKRTPENGLAVFSGNVSEREGQSDVRVYSLEPPIPINSRLYRCDKDFVLDTLEQMLESKEVYGMVVMDRRDAMIALLKGKTIIPIVKTHSEVPGKFKAGGQCLFTMTKVITKDGEKAIKDVRKNEELLAYDLNGKTLYTRCLGIWFVVCNKMFRITAGKQSIQASEDHIFFIDYNRKPKEAAAEELKAGDKLYLLDGKSIDAVKIDSISSREGNFWMVDIETENKNFFANNFVVHNSAQRFARIREGAIKDHYKKIAEYMKDQFLPMIVDLKGIIIGGPSTTTTDFIHGDFLTGDIKKKVLAVKDLSYTGEFGLQELLDKSHDVLAAEEVAEEKKIMLEFFELLAKKPNKVSYGLADVKNKLALKIVDKLLLSEELEEDMIEELDKIATEGGAIVHIISTETREGNQLKELGKVAAILRYEAAD